MDRSGRRREPRFDVADIDGSFVVQIDVKVTNLSLAGMAIETQNTLIVGRRYAFRIRQNDVELDVSGRVMWCVLDAAERVGDDVTPTFRAGIQFEDVLGAKVLQLQKLIEASAIFDAGNEVVGRFVAAFGGSIGIDEQTPFSVKKISLAGMLVDTDRTPRRHEVIPFEARLGDFIFTGHGRVAYIEPYEDDLGAERFRLGIEFTLVSDRARANLERYILALIACDDKQASA
jgi:hypothetical protein